MQDRYEVQLQALRSQVCTALCNSNSKFSLVKILSRKMCEPYINFSKDGNLEQSLYNRHFGATTSKDVLTPEVHSVCYTEVC